METTPDDRGTTDPERPDDAPVPEGATSTAERAASVSGRPAPTGGPTTGDAPAPSAGPDGAANGQTGTRSGAEDDPAGVDALAAVLPRARAVELADVLTDADVATLRHLAVRGIGANSLRALSSDLGYLEAWALAATGRPLPWPAPAELALKFVAHHLWDPEARARDAAHGMPDAVRAALEARGLLRRAGPHAPATVRRRLSSWSTLHRWRDVTGPFAAPALRKALRLATRAADRPRHRKSREAITGDVLREVLGRLDAAAAPLPRGAPAADTAERLRALRDRAVIAVGFAAGGRRRSEIAGLTLDRLTWPEPGDPEAPLLIALGRTKTTDAADDARVAVRGRAVADLAAWVAAARIGRGAVFRPVGRWGHVSPEALRPASVNRIVKDRLAAAGYDPAAYAAHGLRSGYLTESFLQGLSLPEAMGQSGHRSAAQAAAYFTTAATRKNRATNLLE